MALLVTVKHLTTIKGLPYFQRRIPKRLQQHPAVKSTHYKVRLPVDPTDELALLSALNRANEAFTVYVETLTNANLEALTELDLQRRAVLYLEACGLSLVWLPLATRNSMTMCRITPGIPAPLTS